MAVLLAGCGATFAHRSASSHKTTLRSPAAAVTSSTPSCSEGVTVNAHASCPFAERILVSDASPAAEKEEEGSETATVHLTVESPTTHEMYAVACSQASGKRIDCRAVTDAVVTLTFAAVVDARARAQGEHLTPAQARVAEGVLAQRPANPTRGMTPSQKRAYEADQERKAAAVGEMLRRREAAHEPTSRPGFYPHCRYGKQEPEYTHPDREEQENGVKSEEVRPARCLYPSGAPETAFHEEVEESRER